MKQKLKINTSKPPARLIKEKKKHNVNRVRVKNE